MVKITLCKLGSYVSVAHVFNYKFLLQINSQCGFCCLLNFPLFTPSIFLSMKTREKLGECKGEMQRTEFGFLH